jgi:hypothetical protein
MIYIMDIYHVSSSPPVVVTFVLGEAGFDRDSLSFDITYLICYLFCRQICIVTRDLLPRFLFLGRAPKQKRGLFVTQ